VSQEGEMSFEAWVETYKPEKNNLVAEDRNYDGYMFETFGAEELYIKKIAREAPARVWTLVQGDNNGFYLSNGYHWVNRLGYFVTGIPYEGEGLEICVGDPDRYYVEKHNGFDWIISDREAPGFSTVCSVPLGLVHAEEIAEQIAEALNAMDIEFDLSHEEDED
jgi:hypothetical protein